MALVGGKETAVDRARLVTDLRRLGLSRGDRLNVKASLRSIGKVAGGAETLIRALMEVVGPEGLIVSDAFVPVRSPLTREFWRDVSSERSPSYAGALANAMIRHPDSFRSGHPVQRFALIGKDAAQLAANHGPASFAYDILRILCETGGKNLKVGLDDQVPGVGTTHVAIGLAGIRQKVFKQGVRYVDESGSIRSFWVNWSGGCMDAFNQLVPLYYSHPGAVIAEGALGEAPARVTSMAATLELELAEIQQDVASFLKCGNPRCVMCALTWQPSHESLLAVLVRAARNQDMLMFRRAVKMALMARYAF